LYVLDAEHLERQNCKIRSYRTKENGKDDRSQEPRPRKIVESVEEFWIRRSEIRENGIQDETRRERRPHETRNTRHATRDMSQKPAAKKIRGSAFEFIGRGKESIPEAAI
jgi:hypothetical protein